MGQVAAAPEAHEVSFSQSEIHYSRTDASGIIRAGNQAFQRISGFEWDGLIGASHRLIRHPSMPKAVFWLTENAIRQGRPLAAYVKNITQQGGWYWVLAVVLPMEKGYLSVRIKPTTALFEQIRVEYGALSSLEEAQGLTPEASAEVFLARLRALGHDDYERFMSQALTAELVSRGKALGVSGDAQSLGLNEVSNSLGVTIAEQRGLLRAFEGLQSIPINMRIVASRLEPAGGPISAISDNYKIASSEMTRRLMEFAGARGNLCEQMTQEVAEALFLLGCARLQSEVVRQFGQETGSAAPTDFETELALLSRMEADCQQRATSALAQARHAAAALHKSSAEIRRMMLGLDSIRVMGRVESGRLRSGGASLSATIDQLDSHHADITRRLAAIMDLSAQINCGIGRQGLRSA